MSANLISAVHDLVLESGLGAKNIATKGEPLCLPILFLPFMILF